MNGATCRQATRVVLGIAALIGAAAATGCSSGDGGSSTLNVTGGSAEDGTADLVVDVTSLATPTSTNGELIYHVVITNAGPGDAVSVTLDGAWAPLVYTDPVGTFTSTTPGAPTCTHGTSDVTCNLGDLPVGESIEVFATADPGGVGTVRTQWIVNHTGVDPDSDSDRDIDTTPVVDSDADGAVVSVTPSATTVVSASTVSFDIVATNNGPAAASSVDLVFTPSPAALASNVQASADGGSCTVTGGVATCSRPALAVGAEWSMTVTMTGVGLGELTGNAEIQLDGVPDSNASNNTGSASVTIVATATADLSVTVEDMPDPVAVGDSLFYTIEVSNDGPMTATDATVEQSFGQPGGVTFISATSADGACTGGIAPPLTCTFPTLAPGATASVLVEVAPVTTGSVSTTVTVGGPNSDPNPANDSATETSNVVPASGSDLTVSITDSIDPVTTGTGLTYTVRAENLGPQTATGVLVEVALPANFSNIVITPASGTCTRNGLLVTCQIPQIIAGSAVDIDIAGTVGASGGSIMVAAAEIDGVQADANEANDMDTEETIVASTGGADLGVSLLATPDPVLAGDPIEYQVRFFNAGASPALSAEGQFALPPNVSFESLELFDALSPNEGCAYNPVTHIVRCDFETFPVTRVAVLTFSGVANDVPENAPPGGGPYNFMMGAAANVDVPSGDGVDGNEANDTAIIQTTVWNCPNTNPCVEPTLTEANGEFACVYNDLDGATCSEPCFEDGVCSAGSCQLGAAIVCEDTGAECTESSCNPTTGLCEVSDRTGPCVGDDVCVTGRMCTNGVCGGGAPVACPQDDNDCTANACDPATGACLVSQVTGSCDDADPCTNNDQCSAGVCSGTPRVCDDGNPCTDDVCDVTVYGGCGAEPNNNPCDDGDPCTDSDVCQLGTCAGSQTICDDGNPCTDDVCDADTFGGCGFLANTAPCDDGDACTINDLCSGTECAGSTKSCNDNLECTTDSCQADGSCSNVPTVGATCGLGLCVGDYCETANFCDGIPTCNDAGQCVRTPVDCDDDDPCTVDSCEPTTGACTNTPLDCSDQNTECATYACSAGTCEPTFSDAACEDGNQCTADACVNGMCSHTPTAGQPCAVLCEGAGCEINLCDGEPTCNEAGECIQTAVDCDDNDLCTDDACDPATGACSNVAVDCSNLDTECATYECAGATGVCEPAFSQDACDDGDLCTNDSCDTATGQCVNSDVDCSDSNTECQFFSCEAATGACIGEGNDAACDDGDPCTNDACVGSACVHTPVVCDDGNACNGVETCHELTGACVTDGPLVCADDGNPCTDHACDPATGCVATNNTNACDDGSACTDGDVCSAGTCQPGEAVVCADDGNPCTDDLCNPASGCIAVNNADPCDDGSACTDGDFCMAGACQPGAVVDCADDGNGCTDEFCDPASGCVVANNNDPCDDGNACTATDVCSGGECGGSGAVTCEDDGNPCTTELCNPIDGCTTVFNNGPCDDDNVCTVGDSCDGGTCQPGTAATCSDDGNPCTDHACDPVAGCEVINNTAPCDDGNACTTADQCAEGACFGGPDLTCADDGNPCTDAECDPASGCVVLDNVAPCDDGNACSEGDVCADGVCTAGDPVTCADDGNLCTDESCDPVAGCQSVNNTAPCDDGDACTAGDVCGGGSCQSGDAVDCAEDGNPCTDGVCDSATGCVTVNNAAPCDDGNACTNGDVCSNGVCEGGGDVTCTDDGNPCTTEQCDPTSGCESVNNTDACDDGSACTEGDVCAAGVCTPGASVDCDDGNVCTDDTCDPATGCVATNNDDPCVDGDSCNDSCARFGTGVRRIWQATNRNSGADAYGIWLPGFFDGDVTHSVGMTFDGDSYFVWYSDGTAKLVGTAYVSDLGGGTGALGQLWTIEADLVYRGRGAAGQGAGGPKGTGDTTLTDLWQYFDLQPTSRIFRADNPQGDYATLTQRPANSLHPFQIGVSANLKTDDFGAAVWIDYTRYVDGNAVTSAHGDILADFVDYQCEGDSCEAGVCKGAFDTFDCDDHNPCTVDACSPTLGCVHTADPGAQCDDGNACTDNYCEQGICVADANDDPCDDGNACNDACEELPFTDPVREAYVLDNAGNAGWGFYVPGFYDNDPSHKVKLSFDSSTRLVWLASDFLHAMGTVTVTDLGGGTGSLGETFSVDIMWRFRGTGAEGVGSDGPQYGGDITSVPTADWAYFDMITGYLRSTAAPSDNFVVLAQAPNNSARPAQLGVGGNGLTPTPGVAASVTYVHYTLGAHTAGSGQISADTNPMTCTPVDYCAAKMCGDRYADTCN